ncbi:MAG: oligopeptide/dipeptide ABC transporter ATP-binding protein [Deltaproteobacteria bacterium]
MLALEALEVDYPAGRGRVRALRGIDLAVERGETLGIVGESGSGKSSIARAALRLVALAAGRVLWDGVDVTRLSERRLRPLRARLQMVFQDPSSSLDPRMTAGGSVGEALRVHRSCSGGEIPRRVATLLERVGLDASFAERLPRGLSGGQRQRVAIARALAVGAELLVLDEPLSSLDLSGQAQIVDLLLGLQRERALGYLFISHDLRLVRHFANRVLVLYLGRVVEEGPAAEVLARPRHPYTRLLLRSVPSIRGEPLALADGEPPSPLAPPAGCAFQARCPVALERCATDEPRLDALGQRRIACHAPAEDVE